jgi:hypothetical protein
MLDQLDQDQCLAPSVTRQSISFETALAAGQSASMVTASTYFAGRRFCSARRAAGLAGLIVKLMPRWRFGDVIPTICPPWRGAGTPMLDQDFAN